MALMWYLVSGADIYFVTVTVDSMFSFDFSTFEYFVGEKSNK
jgi:hypothetical protein